ncbi:MAG: tRNA (adenosine(37)-N6)-threonylcarbamoyltransferase complex transferase subunit TsaD [Candidatus Omnitrophota bacterium]
MNILGIETSCDETATAIVENGRWIRSSIIASSLKEHARYGGIIPEIASRRHLELINLVTQQALKKANLPLKSIGGIAVTAYPGLVGSLLVGVSFGRALSFALKKPLAEVNHIHAHLYSNFLSKRKETVRDASKKMRPGLPALGLVVSGGHTSLFLMKNFTTFTPLGQTRDDAAGEAFDKVARLLDLGFPGGPVIDRLARNGKNQDIRFPSADLRNTNDFSFSGLKTSVLYHLRSYKNRKAIPIEKIAYAFQKSVVTSLVNKCLAVCHRKNLNTLLVGGGVAANSSLRKRLIQVCQKNKIDVYFPALTYCMDNAAMVAGLGYHLLKKGGSH